MNDGAPRPPVLVRGDVTAHEACQLLFRNGQATETASPSLNLILLHGSWNKLAVDDDVETNEDILSSMMRRATSSSSVALGTPFDLTVCSVQVDRDEESLDLCIGDSPSGDAPIKERGGLAAPSTLPALAVVCCSGGGHGERRGGKLEHVEFDPSDLLDLLRRGDVDEAFAYGLADAVAGAVSSALSSSSGKAPLGTQIERHRSPPINDGECLRLFVSGDRSQVGKSSVCLGLLGSLLRLGYAPSDLGYIKPATQCEAPQLVSSYCASKGIECIPVGPVVYYKGFTRSYLAGETERSDLLLEKAGAAVDALADGKDGIGGGRRRVIIIDGVGYPAVGSITGTDNASVAAACGPLIVDRKKNIPRRIPAPVLLVGKSGVGDAIDSFNLNATYFSSKGVPVIGSLFNRLSDEGYYSLENCRKAVSSYFEQYRSDQRAFGFIPEVNFIAGTRENGPGQPDEALQNAERFVDVFHERVDVTAVVRSARDAVRRRAAATNREVSGPSSSEKRRLPAADDGARCIPSAAKRPKLVNVGAGAGVVPLANGPPPALLTREQIERIATTEGAAAGG